MAIQEVEEDLPREGHQAEVGRGQAQEEEEEEDAEVVAGGC